MYSLSKKSQKHHDFSAYYSVCPLKLLLFRTVCRNNTHTHTQMQSYKIASQGLIKLGQVYFITDASIQLLFS